MRRQGILAVLAFTGTLAATAPGRGQTSEKPMAEALFQAGRELFEKGELEAACVKLDASRRIEPALGTLLHLADCYERMGRLASAWALFEEGASLADAKGQATRAAVAKLRASALKPQLSYLVLDVPSETPGLSITVSGVVVPASSWSVPIPIDPGTCEVRASAPGHRGFERVVDVSREPSRTEVKIPRLPRTPRPAPVPAPDPKKAPRPTPPTDPFWDVHRIIGASLGSVGLGAIAAGAILGARAMVKNDSSLGECRPEDASRCTAHGVDLRDAARDHALASTITLSTGAALLAVGVVVFLTAGAGGDDAAAWQVIPRLGLGDAGVTLGRTW